MRPIKILFFILILLAAGTVLAQGVVPCGGEGQPECKSDHFFVLVSKIIKFFVYTLAVPVATAAIAYAGIIMAVKPADEGKRTQAKEILWAAVIGLVLVLAAALIVDTLVDYLIKPGILPN